MNRSSMAGMAGLILIAALAQGCASSPAAPAASSNEPAGLTREQTSIPFLSHQAIRNWEADGQDGVWVQDVRRDWYYARLMAPCVGLDFATRIAFITQGNTLDRFASIVVPDYEYQRCSLSSFTRSDAPLPRKERQAKAKAEAQAAKEAKAAGKAAPAK